MSNVQLYLSIGIPTLLILVGLVINWTAVKDLSTRMGGMEGDLLPFYRMIGKLEGRMDSIEKK